MQFTTCPICNGELQCTEVGREVWFANSTFEYDPQTGAFGVLNPGTWRGDGDSHGYRPYCENNHTGEEMAAHLAGKRWTRFQKKRNPRLEALMKRVDREGFENVGEEVP